MGRVQKFIVKIQDEYKELYWYEKGVFLLFIIRTWHPAIMDVPVPIFSEEHPEYTYFVLWYFLCTALVELGLFYILYRRTTSLLTLAGVFWAIGKVVDQFSAAAIEWSASEVIWILVVVIYIYTVWKRTQR